MKKNHGFIRFRNIQTELLLKIGLVAVIPLLVISIFNYRYYRADSMQSTADVQSLVNQNTATKIHLYILAQQLMFMEFSKESPRLNYNEPVSSAREKLLQYLGYLKPLSLFDHLMVCDKNGIIIAHLPRTRSRLKLEGQTIKNFVTPDTYFMTRFGRQQIGEYRFQGQIAVMPLVKTSLQDRLYLVGATQLTPLNAFLYEELQILERKNLTAGTFILVDKATKEKVLTITRQTRLPKVVNWDKINEKNRVLRDTQPTASIAATDLWSLLRLKINEARHLMGKPDINTWYADTDDILIGSNPYYLATVVTEEDILYNSSRMLQVTLGIVAIALLIVSLTVMLIAHRFSKPLREIGRKLRNVAHGDYTGRIPVRTEDEFGILSESANMMTRDLRLSARKIRRNIAEISREKQRSEHLLLNILPASIADRLKQDEKVIADHFPEATVLFSDLVGFTQFASKLSAKELVEKLNALFTMFDELLDKFHVEKIKTIGDALMLVSGVPDRRRNHAQEMAKMALAMIDTLKKFNAKHGLELNIRIGMHSGPLIAGVIGKKKFVYDLWGDTVNIASRMESHGIPGCIQISDTTQKLLKGKFAIDRRGKIKVKGKGEMITHILKKHPQDKWDRTYKKD